MRFFIEQLEASFTALEDQQSKIVAACPDHLLFKAGDHGTNDHCGSVGEGVIRSAAAVEQVFGGIMSRLWDDPFEWTLPESLSTREWVLAYLDDVAETRVRGFRTFISDSELERLIPAPTEFKPIFAVLLEFLSLACLRLGAAEICLNVAEKANQGHRKIA